MTIRKKLSKSKHPHKMQSLVIGKRAKIVRECKKIKGIEYKNRVSEHQIPGLNKITIIL